MSESSALAVKATAIDRVEMVSTRRRLVAFVRVEMMKNKTITNADIRAKWAKLGMKFVPYSKAPINWVRNEDEFYWGGADPMTGLAHKYVREDA